MTIKIKPLTPDDYQNWLRLYQGYAKHYKVALTNDGVAATWAWLMDETHPVTGVIAYLDDDAQGEDAVGLAHFRAMPSPLRGVEVGFLDDLFVDPNARGNKVGEVLLDHLAEVARQKSWPVVRWITRDDNYRARSLYDRKAVKSDWNTYEMLI